MDTNSKELTKQEIALELVKAIPLEPTNEFNLEKHAKTIAKAYNAVLKIISTDQDT
jgi:hypothetical protein